MRLKKTILEEARIGKREHDQAKDLTVHIGLAFICW